MSPPPPPRRSPPALSPHPQSSQGLSMSPSPFLRPQGPLRGMVPPAPPPPANEPGVPRHRRATSVPPPHSGPGTPHGPRPAPHTRRPLHPPCPTADLALGGGDSGHPAVGDPRPCRESCPGSGEGEEPAARLKERDPPAGVKSRRLSVLNSQIPNPNPISAPSSSPESGEDGCANPAPAAKAATVPPAPAQGPAPSPAASPSDPVSPLSRFPGQGGVPGADTRDSRAPVPPGHGHSGVGRVAVTSQCSRQGGPRAPALSPPAGAALAALAEAFALRPPPRTPPSLPGHRDAAERSPSCQEPLMRNKRAPRPRLLPAHTPPAAGPALHHPVPSWQRPRAPASSPPGTGTGHLHPAQLAPPSSPSAQSLGTSILPVRHHPQRREEGRSAAEGQGPPDSHRGEGDRAPGPGGFLERARLGQAVPEGRHGAGSSPASSKEPPLPLPGPLPFRHPSGIPPASLRPGPAPLRRQRRRLPAEAEEFGSRPRGWCRTAPAARDRRDSTGSGSNTGNNTGNGNGKGKGLRPLGALSPPRGEQGGARPGIKRGPPQSPPEPPQLPAQPPGPLPLPTWRLRRRRVRGGEGAKGILRLPQISGGPGGVRAVQQPRQGRRQRPAGSVPHPPGPRHRRCPRATPTRTHHAQFPQFPQFPPFQSSPPPPRSISTTAESRCQRDVAGRGGHRDPPAADGGGGGCWPSHVAPEPPSPPGCGPRASGER
ncbi:basic proline-rich protein-like [Cinclus cinclus]|uniref:basic proline-rich protein-like n=1 Tax=Cinclus cinclus TaxID=127875 RepID=UPI002E0F79C6